MRLDRELTSDWRCIAEIRRTAAVMTVSHVPVGRHCDGPSTGRGRAPTVFWGSTSQGQDGHRSDAVRRLDPDG